MCGKQIPETDDGAAAAAAAAAASLFDSSMENVLD